MTVIQSVALTVCVCAIGTALISMLIPNGKTEKIVNLVVGVFLVASILLPLKGVFDEIKISAPLSQYSEKSVTQSEQTYENEVIQLTADNLVIALNTLLEQNEIYPNDIKLNLSKGKQDSIYISKINIYIKKEDKSKVTQIIKLTEENFKITPLVVAES